jgi:cytochrome c-type biogenesis protein
MVSGLSAAELSALGTAPSPSATPSGVPAVRPVPVGGGAPATGAVGVPAAGPVPATPGVDDATAATEGAPDPEELRRHRARLLRGILAFIAGFTVVFTILGASASSLGRLFLTHQHILEMISGILIVVFGAVLVAMAAGVTLPLAVSGEKRFSVRPSVLGAWAPPVMGMAFAFAWTPCIGPVLGSVLALAAGTGGSATGGIALLLAYSLGLGVPFLLSGLAFGRMTDLLARVKGRLRIVDLVGGAILIAFGLLLLTGNVDVASAHISTWLRDLHLNRLSTS